MAQSTWAQTIKLLDMAGWSQHPATQTVNFGDNHAINVRSLEFNDVTASITYRDDDKTYLGGNLTYPVPGNNPCINTDIPMHFKSPYKISDNGAGDGTLIQPGIFNIADISMTVPQGGITEISGDTVALNAGNRDVVIFDRYTNFPLYISDSSAQYWRINVSLSGKVSEDALFGVYPVVMLNDSPKYSAVFNTSNQFTVIGIPKASGAVFSASFTDIVYFNGLNAYLTTANPSIPVRIVIKANNDFSGVPSIELSSINIQYTLEPVSRT